VAATEINKAAANGPKSLIAILHDKTRLAKLSDDTSANKRAAPLCRDATGHLPPRLLRYAMSAPTSKATFPAPLHGLYYGDVRACHLGNVEAFERRRA
jgi:hypothetical protein